MLYQEAKIYFWSRLGEEYKKEDLLNLYEGKDVFESYLFALCLLPLSLRKLLENNYFIRYKELFKSPNLDFILDIYNKIINQGEMKTVDFDYERTIDNEPWNMSPLNNALDELWRSGLINVKRDSNFNKIYTANKIPEKQFDPIFEKQFYKHFIDKTFENMGVATIKEIKNYFKIDKIKIESEVKEMIKAGELIKLSVIGQTEEHIIRKSDIHLIEELNNTPGNHSTLLSPFDNMIRDRTRVLKLFNIDYRLESYLPKNQRKYGYYALPILLSERIIGTIDLKHDRKSNCIVVKNIYLLYSMEKQEHLKEIQKILEKLAIFLKTNEIIFESKSPIF